MALLHGVDVRAIEDRTVFGDAVVTAWPFLVGQFRPVPIRGADNAQVGDGVDAVAKDRNGGHAAARTQFSPKGARLAQQRDLLGGQPLFVGQKIDGLAVLVDGAGVGRQDLVNRRKGLDDVEQPAAQQAKGQQANTLDQVGGDARRALMRAADEQHPPNFVFAAEALDVVAADEGAQAVGDDRDRCADRPGIDGRGQVPRRVAHILPPVVGKLQQIAPAFVTQGLFQEVTGPVVLLLLHEPGHDHDLADDPARLEVCLFGQHEQLGLGEEQAHVGPDHLTAQPQFGTHQAGHKNDGLAGAAGRGDGRHVHEGEIVRGSGLFEDQLRLADANRIAIVQGLLADALASQEGAVGAAQVAQPELIAPALDARVLARDAGQIEDHVVVILPADGKGVLLHGHFPGAGRRLDGQAGDAHVVQLDGDRGIGQGSFQVSRCVDDGGRGAGGQADLEMQCTVANADDVTRLHRGTIQHRLVVEARAVGRVQVDEGPLGVLVRGATDRDVAFDQGNRALRTLGAADDQAGVGFHWDGGLRCGSVVFSTSVQRGGTSCSAVSSNDVVPRVQLVYTNLARSSNLLRAINPYQSKTSEFA